MNGAGRITPLLISPSYDEIVVSKKVQPDLGDQRAPGRVYSFEFTLTAVSKDSGKAEDVNRFRISFDLPMMKGAKAEASGVAVVTQDGKTYLESVAEQFLAAGTSRPIAVQITVPRRPGSPAPGVPRRQPQSHASAQPLIESHRTTTSVVDRCRTSVPHRLIRR